MSTILQMMFLSVFFFCSIKEIVKRECSYFHPNYIDSTIVNKSVLVLTMTRNCYLNQLYHSSLTHIGVIKYQNLNFRPTAHFYNWWHCIHLSWSASYYWKSRKILTHLFLGDLGAVSIRKTVLPGMAIPMLKIRRPNGRLIFNMEIAIRR